MAIDTELARLANSICGISLSQDQLQAFDRYAAELAVHNQRVNLTAITSPEQVRVRHFIDSLSCARVLGPRPGGRLVDIGAGAGFPSLPLRIAFPSLSVSLVESVGKKADFCRHLIRELGLTGVEMLHARAEQVGRQTEHREGYDWAVARAVAGLPTLLEYLLPLLRLGGTAIAMKGESGLAEAHASDRALELLGGKLRQVLRVELPGVVEPHNLIVIEKHSATPERYPRRTGIPAKRPLG